MSTVRAPGAVQGPRLYPMPPADTQRWTEEPEQVVETVRKQPACADIAIPSCARWITGRSLVPHLAVAGGAL